jgi:biotin operon repressor
MRRADRLFEIIQLMRRQKLVRARDLAEKLEVSERTIYRDVRDLMASRVPIEGEAGVGYALRQGFDLPPLMFDEHEIEALVLGARIIESWTDAKLAEAAGNVIAKVEAVIPERLRQHMADTALLAPSRHRAEPITIDASELRRALRRRLKIHFLPGRRGPAERPGCASPRLVLLRPGLAARGVVRAAPGLPLLPARSHLGARRAGRALSPGARQDHPGFSEAQRQLIRGSTPLSGWR